MKTMTREDVLTLLKKIVRRDAISYIDKDGNIIVLRNDCYIIDGEISLDEYGDPVERIYSEALIDEFRVAIKDCSIDWGMDEYEFYDTVTGESLFKLYIGYRCEHYYCMECEPDAKVL